MIITITFHPTIDKYFTVNELLPNSKLHAQNIVLKSGGGGLNVSKVLAKQGLSSKAFVFSGGRNSSLLTSILEQEIKYQRINTECEIRENVIIQDTSNNQEYRFNMPISELPESAYLQFLTTLQKEKTIKFLVLSGTLGENFSSSFYQNLYQWALDSKIKLIIDTKGKNLKIIGDIGAYLIKPNKKEFNMIASSKANTNEEIEVEAKKLLSYKKIENILVSLGKEGALLIDNNETTLIPAPEVLMTNSVGAGDSLVAGVLFKLNEGIALKEAVQYGVLCAAATAINKKKSIFEMDDLLQIIESRKN